MSRGLGEPRPAAPAADARLRLVPKAALAISCYGLRPVLALRDRIRADLGGLPPTFWALWSGMLVNRLASFVITFLGLYLVRERGLGAVAAGQVVSLYGLGLLCAGPLGGTLADRAGRRATMLLGLVAGGSCVAALAFLRSPGALAATTFLAAMGGEMYRPAAMAAIADLVPRADRARAYGLVYWAVNLGWAVSLSVAGFVAERSMSALFLADAATSIAFAVIVLLRVPETRPASRAHEPVLAGMGRALGDRPFAVFLLLHLVALTIFVQFQLAAPLDYAAHGVGPLGFSLLMAMNGLGVVLLQPFTARFVARADATSLLSVSALLFGAGMGLNAFQGHLPAYVAGGLLWTVGEVLGFPVANALVANFAPAELRGRYQGAFAMTWGVAFTCAPLVGSVVLQRFGGKVLWLGCVVVGAAVALGHRAAGASRRRRLAESAALEAVVPRAQA